MNINCNINEIVGVNGSILLKDEKKREPGNSIFERLLKEGVNDVLGVVLSWLTGESYYSLMTCGKKEIQKRLIEHKAFTEKFRIVVPINRNVQHLKFELRMQELHRERLRYALNLEVQKASTIKILDDPYTKDENGAYKLNEKRERILEVSGFLTQKRILNTEFKQAEKLQINELFNLSEVESALGERADWSREKDKFGHIKALFINKVDGTCDKEHGKLVSSVRELLIKCLNSDKIPDFPKLERLSIQRFGKSANGLKLPESMLHLKCIEVNGKFPNGTELPMDLNFPIKVVIGGVSEKRKRTDERDKEVLKKIKGETEGNQQFWKCNNLKNEEGQIQMVDSYDAPGHIKEVLPRNEYIVKNRSELEKLILIMDPKV